MNHSFYLRIAFVESELRCLCGLFFAKPSDRWSHKNGANKKKMVHSFFNEETFSIAKDFNMFG